MYLPTLQNDIQIVFVCLYILSIKLLKCRGMYTSHILEVTAVVALMLCLPASFDSHRTSEGPAPWLCTKDSVSEYSGTICEAGASLQRVSQQPRVCILEIVLAAGGIILR